MTVSPRLRPALFASALLFPLAGGVSAQTAPAPSATPPAPAAATPPVPMPAAVPAKPAPAATVKPVAKPVPPARLALAFGKPEKPAPALLAAAKTLRDAAAARDVDAVFAVIADDVVFVSSGTTLGVPRSIETKGPFADGATALETIGLAFGGGKGAASASPVEPADVRIRRALDLLVTTIDGAHWASDPLVPGATCTSPGVKWDVAVAKKNGLAAAQGAFVLADTVLRVDRKATAKPVATLKPGTMVRAVLGGGGDWEKVTLPPDKLAWAPPKALRTATPRGFCFLPTAEGDFLLAAVIAAWD